MVTVTQITMHYNSGMQESISIHITCQTSKWKGYSSRRPVSLKTKSNKYLITCSLSVLYVYKCSRICKFCKRSKKCRFHAKGKNDLPCATLCDFHTTRLTMHTFCRLPKGHSLELMFYHPLVFYTITLLFNVILFSHMHLYFYIGGNG